MSEQEQIAAVREDIVKLAKLRMDYQIRRKELARKMNVARNFWQKPFIMVSICLGASVLALVIQSSKQVQAKMPDLMAINANSKIRLDDLQLAQVIKAIQDTKPKVIEKTIEKPVFYYWKQKPAPKKVKAAPKPHTWHPAPLVDAGRPCIPKIDCLPPGYTNRGGNTVCKDEKGKHLCLNF